MKKAINQYGKLVDIIESIKTDTYTCPICNEILTRNFGEKSQYYSHPKGTGDECELKIKLILKENESCPEENIYILKKEYYDKEFPDVTIELSDYKTNDRYFLTQEQKEIIISKEKRIKISALAGSAKTSTLYYYAKERPFKKILYIVYNRAMKDEADKTFGKLKNVEVRTQHSLAYGYVGKFYKNKLTLNYGVVDVIKDLNLDWNKDMELASKVYGMMNEYMLSDVEDFNDLEMFDDSEKSIIVSQCRRLWDLQKEYYNNAKVTHDFYLKCFQLSKKDLSNKYDILLLDECQDSSLLTLDIIKSSNIEGVVMVGDSYQQLYSWRLATNIMPYFEGKEYRLTTSFRVSQNIANITNMIVKDICGVDINMKGFNTSQKIVSEINKNEPFVCLCRTNAYIFAEAFEVLLKNKYAKLFFEGGYSSYNFNNILDGYYFSNGHRVKNPLFNKFKDYYSMIDYANEVDEHEILAIHKMIDKYGSKIPDIINGIKNNVVKDKKNADVILSTVHRAKGQTYVIPVYISDDIINITDKIRDSYYKGIDLLNFYEDMCIIYVAITRAFSEIEFPEKIKEYLLFKLDNHPIKH